MLRFLLWRLLAVLAVLVSYVLVGWFLHGGPGRLLRAGSSPSPGRALAGIAGEPLAGWRAVIAWAPARPLAGTLALALALLALARFLARRRRSYVRVRIEMYRTDQASPMASVASGLITST